MVMSSKMMTAANPTESTYLESISDPFFKAVAGRVIPPVPDDDKLTPATTRLDDLEVDLRKQLFEILLSMDTSSNSIEEVVAKVGSYWRLALDLCHHLVFYANKNDSDKSTGGEKDVRYENMAARRLPILLISDCLDGLPSQEACQLFWSDYVELALDDLLFKDLFWGDEKLSCHLPFLKVCNQFLKGLETSSESTMEWKGKILWDMAKGFSIADKSALKLWGSFHTNNATEYETKHEFDDQTTVLSTSTAPIPASTPPVDFSLYEAFWSLQRDFANPNGIQVGDFIKKLRMVLTALESAASFQSSTCTTVTKYSMPNLMSPKYLTSSSLLPLQLANPDFRCNVVTQFLIVASHLGAESPPLKNAMLSFVLRARKLLENDNPELYDIVWNCILTGGREDEWRQWKKQKCQPKVFAPKRKPSSEGSPDRKKMRLLDGPLGDSGGAGGDDLSSEEAYKFLCLEEIKKSSIENRDKVPTLEQHLEPYVEALDPDSGIEEEYHPKNDSLYTWRAMRLYAKHQLPLLSKCRRPGDLERITRQWYKSQGKVIPGETPPEVNDDGDDDNEEEKDNDEKSDDEEDLDMKDDGHSEGSGEKNEANEEFDENSLEADGSMEDILDRREIQNAQDEIQNAQDGEGRYQLTEPRTGSDNESDAHGSAADASIEEQNPEQVDYMEKEEDLMKDAKEEQAEEDQETGGIIPPPVEPKEEETLEQSKSDNPEDTPAEEKIPSDVSTKVEATAVEPGRQGVYEKFRPPPSRDTDAPRGGSGGAGDNKPKSQTRGGPRANEGGRGRAGNRDDGLPSRRNRNEDQPARGRGVPARGGRHDDEYRGDSGRQQRFGGDRGFRDDHRGSGGAGGPRDDHRGDSGSGGGPRDDHHRSGRVNRDDYRSGDRGSEGRRGGSNDGRPFRGGGGGGRRDRRR